MRCAIGEAENPKKLDIAVKDSSYRPAAGSRSFGLPARVWTRGTSRCSRSETTTGSGTRSSPTAGWGIVGDNPPTVALNRFSAVPVAAVAADRWQLDVFAMAADGRIRRNYRPVRSSGLKL